jgi:transposase
MSAKDVKAYVKRNKNDAADAEAICETVRRPIGANRVLTGCPLRLMSVIGTKRTWRLH